MKRVTKEVFEVVDANGVPHDFDTEKEALAFTQQEFGIQEKYLKHNLYYYGKDNVKMELPNFFLTDDEINQLIEELRKKIVQESCIIPAGTKFTQYPEDNTTLWVDWIGVHDGFYEDDFESLHLTDIKP